MALNVRNRTTEELAATLAKLTRETKTQAVTTALRDRLERIRRRRIGSGLADDLDEIALHCASLPILDEGAAEDILGYDRTRLTGLMVIDLSALIAILQAEAERRAFNQDIEAAERRVVSVASFVEASMIVEARYGPDGVRDLDLFIAKAGIELVAVD